MKGYISNNKENKAVFSFSFMVSLWIGIKKSDKGLIAIRLASQFIQSYKYPSFLSIIPFFFVLQSLQFTSEHSKAQQKQSTANRGKHSIFVKNYEKHTTRETQEQGEEDYSE